MQKFKDSAEFWIDRWKRKPDASGAKPITYNAIQDRLTELMTEDLLKVNGKKILDLGCGRGETLEWLVGVYGAIGTGVDIGAAPIKYLQSRKLVRAIQEDLRKFRDGENKYDVILSCFALQHMESDEDVLSFYDTVLAHLDRRGLVVLVDKFSGGSQPMSFPRPFSFHEKIWENLRLREMNRRPLTKVSTDPCKFVVILKRKRPGWKNQIQEVSSGLIVGKENENPMSPEQLVCIEVTSEPSGDSFPSTDLLLLSGHLPDPTTMDLPEDLCLMCPAEEASGQPSTEN